MGVGAWGRGHVVPVEQGGGGGIEEMRRTQCRWNGEGGGGGETYTVPLERGGGGGEVQTVPLERGV